MDPVYLVKLSSLLSFSPAKPHHLALIVYSYPRIKQELREVMMPSLTDVNIYVCGYFG